MAIKTTIKSLNNQQTFLRLLIFSFVTVMIWIGFSLFSSQQKTQISPELLEMAIPLNPRLDMEVIDRIEQKRFYSPEELSNFTIYTLKYDASGQQVLTTLSGEPVSPASKETTEQTSDEIAPEGTPNTTEPATSDAPIEQAPETQVTP